MKQSLQFFNYHVTNQSAGSIDIYVDGYIVDAPTQELMREWYGDDTSVSFKSIRNQITDANPKTINLYVNSGGGSVVDAMAIRDFLVEQENKGVTVNRYGVGIIGSAATFFLMGKNSHISENSWFMVHNVSGGFYGDVNEAESFARTMRKFNDQVRDLYVSNTGKPTETISAWMNKETWFSGKEALENGFVKNLTGQADFKNSIKPESWPFANTHVLNAYNSSVKNTDMKIDFEGLKNAVKAVLIENGLIKKEDEAKESDLANNLVQTVENALKPLTDKFDENVANSVATLLAKTGPGTVSEALQNAVTKATENMATKTEVSDVTKRMEALENNVTDKLGGSVSQKENTEDRKISDKRSLYQIGNFSKQ